MIKLKPFKQSYGCCVPANCKMVMDYFGFEQTEDFWKKKTGKYFINGDTGKREYGYWEDKFLKFVKTIGYHGFCKDNSDVKEIESFIKKDITVMVNWFSPKEGAHFSVVVGFDKNKIFLADPAFGKIKKYELDWFLKRWSDHGLVKKDYPKNDPGWVHRICVVYK